MLELRLELWRGRDLGEARECIAAASALSEVLAAYEAEALTEAFLRAVKVALANRDG